MRVDVMSGSGAPSQPSKRFICLSGVIKSTTTTRRRRRRRCYWPKVKAVNGSVATMILFTFLTLLMLPPLQLLLVHNNNNNNMLAKAEATSSSDPSNTKHEQQQSHPALLVDRKYWIRNMEFGERDNWRHGRKPCTLIERIAISGELGEATISLGDALDALGGGLESNVMRDLMLAPTGQLLLEDDTLSVGQVDPMFIQYLNQSGDCVDSTALASDDQVFVFEPPPDELSWFNPANWLSQLNRNEQISPWVPESHQIPCVEDEVVFGDRQVAFWPTVEANERAKLIAFKVNFRASESVANKLQVKANNLRVSRLRIGEQSYSQQEFDQLQELYGNSLFDFDDELSVFYNQSTSSDINYQSMGKQSIIIIDESSIINNNNNNNQQQQDTPEMDRCLDEAGCLCGNEQPDVMQVICSFNEPLHNSQLPCHDPIPVAGYCNKICATNILITMDPTKFSERYMSSVLRIMLFESKEAQQESNEYFLEYIFVAPRRVDYGKYEVTLRLAVADDESYERALGREVELAQLIVQHLEKAATKSFYGIKTINVKSSVNWRRNTRDQVFWLSLLMLASIVTLMISISDDNYYIVRTSDILIFFRYITANMTTRNLNSMDDQETHSSSYIATSLVLGDEKSEEEIEQSTLPRQSVDLALVDLDARSITDSTCNLIDPSE